jgi:hypothetical protein
MHIQGCGKITVITEFKDAVLVRYALGGPYFEDLKDCEYADKWRRERAAMSNVAPTEACMRFVAQFVARAGAGARA